MFFAFGKLATLTTPLRSGSATAGMPFIDDALLWCPDNDGRMVDISTCLQVKLSFGKFEQTFMLYIRIG